MLPWLDATTDDVVADAGLDAIELVDGPNVLSVIINQGLSASNSVDEPFVSVTLCMPGSSQCETRRQRTVHRLLSAILKLF